MKPPTLVFLVNLNHQIVLEFWSALARVRARDAIRGKTCSCFPTQRGSLKPSSPWTQIVTEAGG